MSVRMPTSQKILHWWHEITTQFVCSWGSFINWTYWICNDVEINDSGQSQDILEYFIVVKRHSVKHCPAGASVMLSAV